MSSSGLDSATPVTAALPAISAAGFDFVGRYYSRNPAKNLIRAETQLIIASGLRIVSVWESAGNEASSFSATSGARDAHDAAAEAQSCGQPPGSTIFFAVDFDASEADLPSLRSYFTVAGQMLGTLYSVGVYGSGLVCQTMLSKQLAKRVWIAGASGWRGTADFLAVPPADFILQKPTTRLASLPFAIDPDEGFGDFGSWPTPAGNTAPAEVPVSAVRDLAFGMTGADVTELQAALESFGAFSPAPALFDDTTHLAVVHFQKASGLAPDGLVGPQTRAKLGLK